MEKIQFSIIVPVLHESDKIDLLIDHLNSLECREGSEIIVVDGSPELDTIDAIRSEQVIKLKSAKGRGRQMNVGASVARGEILIFLHADTELPTGALRKIASVVGQDKYVGGAFELGIKSEKFAHKSLARLASLRCRLTRIPYGDQAIFIRRDYFNRIGGYREISLMEDVELMRRIKHIGKKICILPDRVMTSARRWDEEGFVFVLLRNTILFTLYILGVSAEKLARFYRSEYRGSRT
jgi:rSAM/selenodomain-associated transferase 2